MLRWQKHAALNPSAFLSGRTNFSRVLRSGSSIHFNERMIRFEIAHFQWQKRACLREDIPGMPWYWEWLYRVRQSFHSLVAVLKRCLEIVRPMPRIRLLLCPVGFEHSLALKLGRHKTKYYDVSRTYHLLSSEKGVHKVHVLRGKVGGRVAGSTYHGNPRVFVLGFLFVNSTKSQANCARHSRLGKLGMIGQRALYVVVRFDGQFLYFTCDNLRDNSKQFMLTTRSG